MSTIMGLGDLLGAYLGGSYSTPQATVAGDGSTGQSTSYLPSGTASDVAGAIGNGLYPQETQQSPFAYYSPPAANTNYQMTGSPQQGGLTAPGILTPGVLGGGGVGTGTVLGANTNTVPAGGFNYGGYGGGAVPSSFGGTSSTSAPIQLPPLPLQTYQQYQGGVAQLAADKQYQQIMNQYNQMMGLAGTEQAGQQYQNQLNTQANIGNVDQQALGAGYGNTTILPGLQQQAISQGAQAGFGIANNANQNRLAILQAKANAKQALPPPVQPGEFNFGQVANEANTLYGGSAARAPQLGSPTTSFNFPGYVAANAPALAA